MSAAIYELSAKDLYRELEHGAELEVYDSERGWTRLEATSTRAPAVTQGRSGNLEFYSDEVNRQLVDPQSGQTWSLHRQLPFICRAVVNSRTAVGTAIEEVWAEQKDQYPPEVCPTAALVAVLDERFEMRAKS